LAIWEIEEAMSGVGACFMAVKEVCTGEFIWPIIFHLAGIMNTRNPIITLVMLFDIF
jgi:hypothetical protein